MNEFYTTNEFAEITKSKPRTVLLWAKNNHVNFLGTGRHKIYTFSSEDIERFKNRPKPGRRWSSTGVSE
jgi:hypothetical protein